MNLPVSGTLPALREALDRAGAAVLQAPPGAGKTTLVPLELLEQPWLAGRRIIMLEPRRLAVRAAARRMASLLGEPVGRTVGYRVRFDSRVSEATRIEVVTEGVLTRQRLADPALETAGLLIFDEFHERSLPADLGLALALETRAVLRPELRLLVMSATLDGGPISALLGAAPVMTSEGRLFEVETRHRPRPPGQRLDIAVAAAIAEALEREEGDLLAFLPGAGEINRTAERLEARALPRGVRLFRLHGQLPADEQDAAIAPAPPGGRKVVLATSIAETSLTIEGVRIVVDGGLMRVPRFSPRTGMTRLETVRVTRASADQRRGRAGRTAPGVCYRLWSPLEEAGLIPFNQPEILTSDLASMALDLAAAGIRDPARLQWLDPPPAAAWRQAVGLLQLLGGLDRDGKITPHGGRMAALPVHPRLAHMLIEAHRLGETGLAAEIAALLADRDIARRSAAPAGGSPSLPDADIRLRIEALRRGRGAPGFEVDSGALHRARAEATEWRKRLHALSGGSEDHAGRLLAMAYPDRIGRGRGGAGRFLLQNGRGASLPAEQPLATAEWIVAAELDDEGTDSTIRLAAPLRPDDVRELVDRNGVCGQRLEWDPGSRSVVAWNVTELGAITVERRRTRDADPARVLEILLGIVRAEGLDQLPWSDTARSLRSRLAFLHRLDPTWPDVSNEALLSSVERWLGPVLLENAGLGRLSPAALSGALSSLIPRDRRTLLDRLAPERIEVPSGSQIGIDYTDPAAPVLAVRLQEVFGLHDTPRIGGGQVPLTLHLLSPASRPVQVTRDLASFWKSGYFDVRKDLRGRYPRHSWPDDPLTAPATRRARRKP